MESEKERSSHQQSGSKPEIPPQTVETVEVESIQVSEKTKLPKAPTRQGMRISGGEQTVQKQKG